ncbi:type II secretion system ATPase GspE [Thiomicrorhabdus arctica]|uniref:type II secretion system ATPase GspE n=1 Tax=Thiomicrorhabdus arctica TaxID=131540 RepID=UPI00036614FD|nr:type II secretion system ATPase GspE [Thiomicrorhabdus arctica]
MSIELSFSFARKNQVVLAIAENSGILLFYTDRTPVSALLEMQRRLLESEVSFHKLSQEVFEEKIKVSFANRSSSSMESIQSIETHDLETVFTELGEPEDLLDSSDEAPIIKLLNAILTEAIRENASDIHIEPFENQLRIRFRVDGVLHTVLSPKQGLAPMLVSRIKVMARLDIAEKRLPQDGRMALKLGGRAVDLRVSTIPSSFGERVVLRILDKGADRLMLSDLGMPAKMEEGVQQALSKSHGIFLVTGPTGSGKTTTLYAGLGLLNDSQRNIMTIEDPVEYNIDGINQTQVNMKADMSFARGLRAILRQDPDVVMIGEIRDQETANIAVQASLTGHLVLTTLHTNTAVGAITRLRDMGIEPFLLSSSLVGVLSQRLVRCLCSHCQETYSADAAECKVLGVSQAKIHRPVGCAKCKQTGYQGRMGLYELILINDQVRSMINDKVAEIEIEKVLRKHSRPLHESGYAAVLDGRTSLQEVLRVTQV